MKLNTFLTLLIPAGILILAACSNNPETESDSMQEEKIVDLQKYIEQGRSISQKMQGILLSNVSSAMQKGGPAHAIAFCNTRAIPLTDSLSEVEGVKISRISDKNRNPNNFASSDELKLINQFKTNNLKDTVLSWDNNENYVYYSTIKTGMPACMKCHGSVDADISSETLNALDSLYPEDKAKNYSLGDFRGLWKIEFAQ
ncbi:MAG: Tll0287-like domain-containing protein [Crocinitomicaceae bacterium]